MQDLERGKFTYEEIMSQPETWEETLNNIRDFPFKNLPNLSDYDHIVISGCGSTHYLSIWAARLIHQQVGVPAFAFPSAELWVSIEDWIKPLGKTLLLAISRSGKTTETIHAVNLFKEKKLGEIFVITCDPESDLAKLADNKLITDLGQEKSIAQTRSFTNMMWPIIYLIEKSIPEDIPLAIRSRAKSLLANYEKKVKSIGSNLDIARFFFLADGSLYGLANEVMLKMKEMSLSYSEAYHFMEFRHGPMSMVNDKTLVVGFIDQKYRDFEISVLKDMRNLGAKILAISNNALDDFEGNFDYFFNLGENLDTPWIHPLYLPTIQMIAFHRSIEKGLNPDKPENLTAVVEI